MRAASTQSITSRPASSPPSSIPSSPQSPRTHFLDDIFATSSPHSPSHNSSSSDLTFLADHPSDIPRLRAIHSTAGYREGLSASKAPALQPGFDEGYTLGAVLGLKVGEVLGILDGLVRALGGKQGREEAFARALQLWKQAALELELREVFGREFWGEDGVWLWEVTGVMNGKSVEMLGKDVGVAREAEVKGREDVTFEVVAAAHPLVTKWTGIVETLMQEWGVTKGLFQGEEWEAGRVGVEGNAIGHAVGTV
ncbi:Essential protein Yae1, N terminal [Lambiella insularis]|nr:Essential protein Yae1, N terminal [Lambiella insularis]